MPRKRRTYSRSFFLRSFGAVAVGLVAACGPAGGAPTSTPGTAGVPAPSTPKTGAVPAAATAAKAGAAAAPTAPAKTAATAAPTARTYTPASVRMAAAKNASVDAIRALVTKLGYGQQFAITEIKESLTDANKVTASVIAGEQDVGAFFGVGGVLAAIEQGGALKMIAGCRVKSNLIVYASNPAIRTIRDLEGRSVGTGAVGALLHQTMMALFKKHGVDASRVEFVNVGSSPDIFRAIAAKKIDAGMSTVDLQPSAAGLGVAVVAEVAQELPDFVGQGMFVGDHSIAEKRDALVRLLAAYGQVFRFLRMPESEAAFVQAYQEAGGTADDARFDWKWQRDKQAFAYDLVLSEAQIAYQQQVNIDSGAQKDMLPFNKVADMSLARDALAIMTVR